VTGAHLHYEFLQNGVHRNPRTVKLPLATPLGGTERHAFLQQANVVLAQLQNYQQAYLAQQSHHDEANTAAN
jgi:murein DD-endopeptidase MepM/ murein hydrolase activator NlpD